MFSCDLATPRPTPRDVNESDAAATDPRQPLAGRETVTVHAPGRLHLGFLDPAGWLGRRFGSLGLVVDGFETVVELAAANADTLLAGTPAAQLEAQRAWAHIGRLRELTGCSQPLRLKIHDALPPHAGFGSGTQLALAVGRAFARLFRLDLPTAQLAVWLGRGLRSGIGIAGFDQGGLLLDGGPSADGTPAPLLSRMELPQAWCVMVVQDTTMQGLSGSREKQAIATLPPLPQAAAAEICHQMLMRVLPGAACGDFAAFAAGITRAQELLGEHYAPAQGGSAYTSAAVGQLVQWIAEAHGGPAEAPCGAAVGQSSWGPTAFAILPSKAAAQAALQAAQSAGLLAPGLDVRLVRARNRGASLGVR
jgi:beta-ribofuranosylaminobenzene 5'-phosphate synthase